jgi:phospholipid/cholesterol/gamma-HCH transport system substrate-binding protein
MDTKLNYTLIGLFTFLLILGLIAIILWLSVGPSTKAYATYLAYMQESVAGLNPNAPVKYRGVDVGKVERIELDREDPERVRLTLGIEENVPIKENTMAILASSGLTGIAYVELTGGTKDSPLLEAKQTPPYPVIDTGPSLFVRLDTALTHLLAELTGVASDISRIAQSVDTVLIEQNQQALTKTLQNTERFSQALASLADSQETQRALFNTLSNTERLTAHLAAHGARLEAGIDDLSTILEEGAKASTQFPLLLEQAARSLRPVEKTAQELERLLREGQEGIQLFSQSTSRRIDQLFNDFDQIAQNLEHFSEQVGHNPRTLLFGPPPARPGPGE